MKAIEILQTIVLGGAVIGGSSGILAQTIGVEYTTEWQTDFKGGYDWLNLLKAGATLPVTDALSVEATTISTAKTGGDSLIDDLLTYSNIEAGNIPLTLARLGLAFQAGKTEFFAGINNVNEDYFTSDLTAFFTNSSCGISPTISCNYDIANYPLASWCLHYRQQLGAFALQTSLYPGRGYSRLLGHDNLFRLDIGRDGIFSISSLEYKKNGIHTVLGLALHHGVCIADEDGEQAETQAPAPEKKFTAAPWLLAEIELPVNLGLLVHGSLSTVATGCKAYAGLGLVYSGWRVQPGVSANYASFTGASEYDIELTARIPLIADKAFLQPALHVIGTDSHHHCIGMLRLQVEI